MDDLIMAKSNHGDILGSRGTITALSPMSFAPGRAKAVIKSIRPITEIMIIKSAGIKVV